MTALADQAVRDRITGADGDGGLEETLFIEAGAGSGKTRALVERVVALVGTGIPMRHIAAITFTEKAAAELRDRIRHRCEDRFATAADEGARGRWRAALEQVDGAAIGTLHAFAQRLLTERPIEAALPPNVEVLDEVASEIAFEERWGRFREALLDDPALSRSLLLGHAAGVDLGHLRDLASAFGENWDLVAERVRWPAEEPPPLPIDAFLAELDGVVARAAACVKADDTLLPRLEEIATYARRLREAPDEYEQLRLLGERRPTFKVRGFGLKGNWPGCDLAELREQVARLASAREELRNRVAVASLYRLGVALRDFTLEAARERREQGRLEFHDLLVLARGLLRGRHGAEVREALRGRYRRLLLDEFQDTDPIQVELAVLLGSSDPNAGDKHWRDIAVDPGRLFFVGDPKQSIYRFRRADIALFLDARGTFGSRPLQLSTNFRTTPPVIDWINHVFGRLITPVVGSQPAYEPLAPAPGRAAPLVGPPVTLLGRRAHPDERLSADELREREAADVADAVTTAVAGRWAVRAAGDAPGSGDWRPARLGDITILLPARTSLPALEHALEQRGIAYRAETSSLVYSTREVRDLLAAVRAVADPSDQLALVTALRSAVFGCGDDDLFTYRQAGGRWNCLAPLPGDLAATHPVCEAMRYLAELHREHVWATPSELLDRLVRDRRLFELGFAGGRPRDLWRRLRFVVDQSRAWSETEGGTLREYLAWARLQASDSVRLAETVLPETDDDSVRIMTIHASKGLEFPITILSGLTTAWRGRRPGVQLVWPLDGTVGIKARGVVSPEFKAFEPLDEQMSFDERLRLLYVACTRSRDHLVVSLHRKARKQQPQREKRTNAELLAEVCADAPHQEDFVAALASAGSGGEQRPRAPALADLTAWERERDAVVLAGSRPRTIGATGVARLAGQQLPGDPADATAPGAGLGVDPGTEKDPRDLDLPPWMKGRYGTAVGRAVHAVLQTVDLATGAGLEETVAAQAAAEGVVGREADIRALAAAALVAPSVREAVGHPRWRETYVAAPMGDTTLEGYVDLLYRTAEGLVIVDYKTAGSDADLDERAAGYRLQGAAYALAVERATGERVARVAFVFLTPDGPVERAIADLPAAVEQVRALLAGVGA
jgi:ATP-dependent exoDNAse (exonuclease V) beta subunit